MSASESRPTTKATSNFMEAVKDEGLNIDQGDVDGAVAKMGRALEASIR